MVKAWEFHDSSLPGSKETLPMETISLQTSSQYSSPATLPSSSSNSLPISDDNTLPPPRFTDILAALLRACDLTYEAVPAGIVTSADAAFSSACPTALRELARQRIALFGCEDVPRSRQPSPTGRAPAAPPQGVSPALQREIDALRAILPKACERRMLGASDHSYYQATSAMRWQALSRKYLTAGGHDGRGWARDRRALQRWLKFCESNAIRDPFPIGAPAFSAFLAEAKSSSTGSKGGATVEHNLKLCFVHMKTHLALEAELDAPCLFNAIKPYKGDSDTATSPSLWALAEWERLAVECPHPSGRLAARVAVLACWLTLRASHFIGTTVLESATDDDIRLNLARDKDGSQNVWAGCDASGLLGKFSWWPEFRKEALLRGFLVPNITLNTDQDPDPAKCSVGPEPCDSKSLVRMFTLAFCLLGVSSAEQKVIRFTGHSPRHLLPSIAELCLWAEKMRDELGRWATGAANAKRTKCGPRYTVQANQALQLNLRRRVRRACLILLPFVDRDGPGAMVPCFEALASLDALTSSEVYGESGVGYAPCR